MSRYLALRNGPRAILTFNDPHTGRPQTVGGEVVFESGDDSPSWTGLYDGDGVRIFRCPERNRIGFDLGWEDDE